MCYFLHGFIIIFKQNYIPRQMFCSRKFTNGQEPFWWWGIGYLTVKHLTKFCQFAEYFFHVFFQRNLLFICKWFSRTTLPLAATAMPCQFFVCSKVFLSFTHMICANVNLVVLFRTFLCMQFLSFTHDPLFMRVVVTCCCYILRACNKEYSSAKRYVHDLAHLQFSYISLYSARGKIWILQYLHLVATYSMVTLL